jgi:hypothetical protein
MHPATLVTLNIRELDRLKVIQAVIEERLMPWRAAGGSDSAGARLSGWRTGIDVKVLQDLFHADRRPGCHPRWDVQWAILHVENH